MVFPMPPAGLIEIHNDPKHPVPGMGDDRLLAAAPPEAIAELVRVAGPSSGSPLLSVELCHLGGALGRRRPGHGALGALDAAYSLFGAGIVTGPEAAAALEAALTTLLAALARWDRRPRLPQLRREAAGRLALLRGHHARSPARRPPANRPARSFLANHPV
jgi:hypothetical protein